MLGWSPRDFWEASLGDVLAAIRGWNRANSPTKAKPAPMSRERLDELMALYPDE